MEHHRKSGFTVRDILLIPDVQEAVLLAGAKGLDRQISRVNVMEVPDVIDWVRPGEFLVTSGFPFRDQPEAITELIPQLAARGVAALGIKKKRFIERIPEEALSTAERLDFPIFELPVTLSFSDVVRDIMERVLVQEARELSLLQSRFQKLSQHLLHGMGMEDFLKTLEGMLNNPVILLDDDHPFFLSPLAKQLVLDESDTQDVLSQFRNTSNPGVHFLSIRGRRVRAYVSAIHDKYSSSLLVLLEWSQEYTMVDQLTIERVGVLIRLEMMNAQARKQVESKYIDQFLQDWVTGRIVEMDDVCLRAEACGCPLLEGHVYYAGLVRWNSAKPSLKRLQQVVKRIWTSTTDMRIYATLVEGNLALVFSLPPQGSIERAVEEIRKQLRTLLSLDEMVSLCLGNRVDRPDEMKSSFQQAKKIHDISEICGVSEPYIDAARLGIFQLLYLLPDSGEVWRFRDRYIKPLIIYDKQHGTSLLATLRLYFKHNRNARKTSRELFTHYNTINYRVDRALGLLGIDPESGDDMLQLEIAIKLHEMRPLEIET